MTAMGIVARVGIWLAVLWLATACAGMAGPSATSPPAYYPGPAYFDPARGVMIDPFSGQPLYGGGR
jgi:hypothetical protein